MPMDPLVKLMWTADLRSVDQSVQGRGHLTQIIDGKMFDCCLGRLCKLAILSDVKLVTYVSNEPQDGMPDWKLVPCVNYDGAADVLPDAVTSWANLDEAAPNIVFRLTIPEADMDLAVDLADLNDSGLTFKQIADVIDFFL